MKNLILICAAWVAASVPVALVLGRLLKRASSQFVEVTTRLDDEAVDFFAAYEVGEVTAFDPVDEGVVEVTFEDPRQIGDFLDRAVKIARDEAVEQDVVVVEGPDGRVDVLPVVGLCRIMGTTDEGATIGRVLPITRDASVFDALRRQIVHGLQAEGIDVYALEVRPDEESFDLRPFAGFSGGFAPKGVRRDD